MSVEYAFDSTIDNPEKALEEVYDELASQIAEDFKK
jgi:hypothetical protein